MDNLDYLDGDEVVVQASFHRLKRARRGYIGGCIETTSAQSSGSSSFSKPTNMSGESVLSDGDYSSRVSHPSGGDSRHNVPSQKDPPHPSSKPSLPTKRRRQSPPPQSAPSHPTSSRDRQSSRTPHPGPPTAQVSTVATHQSFDDDDDDLSTDDEYHPTLPLQPSKSSLHSTTTFSNSDTLSTLSDTPSPAPDTSLSASGSSLTAPDASTSSCDTPIPRQGPQQPPQTCEVSSSSTTLFKYLTLPIGTLPPVRACRRALKQHLAKVPIREYNHERGRHNILFHFFSNATKNEVAKDGRLQGMVLCRAMANNGLDCKFSLCQRGETSMYNGLKHIGSEHRPMMLELYEFWSDQQLLQLSAIGAAKDSQAKDSTTDTQTDQHPGNCLVPVEEKTPQVDHQLRPLPLTPVSPTLQDGPKAAGALQDNDAESRADQEHNLPAVEEQGPQVGDRPQPPRIASIDMRPKRTSSEQLTRIIANAIAVDSLPMSILDTTLVKSLVSLSSPTAVVPNRRAVESALLLSYMRMSAAAKEAILETDISLGSFAADIWKSHQGKRFLGLTFHYLSRDFKPHTVLLGIKLLEKSLTPRNIKHTIDDVLHEWGLMDKVFCGTADERVTLKKAMGQVCRQRDNGITSIACACYRIQLCINDALEECKEAATLLKRFIDFLKFVGREDNAEETPGGTQRLQQVQDHIKKHYFWKLPTTYCKPSLQGNDGRLYWCNIYLLVREYGTNLFNECRSWDDIVDLEYEEKLNQAHLKKKESETVEAILPVLQPLFKAWALISSGSDNNSDNKVDNHESGHGSGIGGSVNQVSEISKVYSIVYSILEADSPVTHPIADSLRRALEGQMRKYWNLDNIPDPVLLATFLDPATTGSSIFNSTTERNNARVDLRSYARSLIVQTVQQTLGHKSDDLLAHTLVHEEAAVADTDNTNSSSSSSSSALSKKVDAECVAFFSAVIQDPAKSIWDDPRPWWQKHASDFPILSAVARICFSIQSTSLPPAQLFDRAQETESILTDPRGRANEYTFIRLLTIRNLHKFLHGHDASQLDMANLV